MKIGCTSYKLSNLKALQILINAKTVYIGFWNLLGFNNIKKIDMFTGWGYGIYAQKAKKIATKYHKPFIFIEDGFLRSPFVSALSKQPYSLVIDTKAPYYDGSVVTDLESLICHTVLSHQHYEQANIAIDYFIENKLGKFAIVNDNPNAVLPDGFCADSIVLIDQVSGDLSLKYGGVNDKVAQDAFETLLKTYPNQTIYLKLHPEVLAGKKKGCFDFAHTHKNVVCISNIDLISLLQVKPHLCVLTSLAGFEGLIHGCSVTVFGLPWYAGYGLTDDKHVQSVDLKNRRKDTDLQTLFYCAYMVYTQYVDPISHKKSDFWQIIHHFARIKRHITMMRGHVIAVGIRPWKRKDLYQWLKTPFNEVTFSNDFRKIINIRTKETQSECKIVVWNYKNSELIEKIKQTCLNMHIIRIEDGFVRSYGLGSDFFPPLSLCFDNNHLYFYDTEIQKSDFHKIAHQAPFAEIFVNNTKQFKERIIKENISKYNIDDIKPLVIKTDKQIIFVAGQVSGDASLIYGGLPDNLRNDYDLLLKVRTDYPDSYILYKPHPDVTKGNRAKEENFDKCLDLCDQQVIDASVIACIHACDMVAVLTSQTGFDALIRGKKVICYGQSFYKNYGLCVNDTKNLNPHMDSNHFIHAALMEYPLYKNGTDFMMPNTAIDIILAQKSGKKNPLRRCIIKSKLLKNIYKIMKWIV